MVFEKWSWKNALVLAADVILTVSIETVPIFIVKTMMVLLSGQILCLFHITSVDG